MRVWRRETPKRRSSERSRLFGQRWFNVSLGRDAAKVLEYMVIQDLYGALSAIGEVHAVVQTGNEFDVSGTRLLEPSDVN